jgi:hypothetical protein
MRPCFCDRHVPGQPYVAARDCVLCWLYHNRDDYRRKWDGEQPQPQGRRRRGGGWHLSLGGPGTEFETLASTLGYAERQGCACASLRRKMDRLGVPGCVAQREELLIELRKHAAQFGWLEAARAAKNALLSGLAFQLDPFDPLPGLLEEAIRRAETRKPPFVTTRQLVEDAAALAAKLPPNTAGIVGVARSGVIPASLIATQLHLPLWIFRQSMWDITSAGHGWRLADGDRKGPLVFVDDTCMTGNSVRQARAIAAEQLPGREVLFTVLYRNPGAGNAAFDLWAHDLAHPHFLEWNLFNSIHLPRMAFDFDGIFTCDGTNDPLYLPRRQTIRLVVTGRSEALRKPTQDWLKRWGISTQKLVMYPGPTPRDPLAIARYKAEHFAKTRLRYFVESDPLQAAEIAKLTRKQVICPAAGKVF